MSLDSTSDLVRYLEVIVSHIEETLTVLEWRTLIDVVRTVEIHPHSYRLALPALVLSAGGDDPLKIVPVNAAWILLLLAASLFDDLQDDDRAGPIWQGWDHNLAMNTGLTLLFSAQYCLSQQNAPNNVLRELNEVFSTAGMLAAKGQTLLCENLDIYFRRVYAISGTIFGAGVHAGAITIAERSYKLSYLRDYGTTIGAIVQLKDDATDTDSLLLRLLGENDKSKNVIQLVHDMVMEFGEKALSSLDKVNFPNDKLLRDYVDYLMDF